MRRVWYIVAGAVLIGATAAGVWYFTQNKETANTEPTQSQQQNNAPPTEETIPQDQPQPQTPTTYPVSVYFSKHPDSDDDPSKTFPVSRTSPDLGVAKFSITELLKGPTTDEQSKGYFTYVRLRSDTSSCNGADFTIKIENGVATLQFCKTFDHIGSISDGQAESNIKDTLKQFPTVQKVVILNKSGNCEFDLSGLNLCKQ